MEFTKAGIRRRFFQAESGRVDLLDFGKYARWRFAEVYMEDASYAQWALGLDKIKNVGAASNYSFGGCWIWNE